MRVTRRWPTHQEERRPPSATGRPPVKLDSSEPTMRPPRRFFRSPRSVSRAFSEAVDVMASSRPSRGSRRSMPAAEASARRQQKSDEQDDFHGGYPSSVRVVLCEDRRRAPVLDIDKSAPGPDTQTVAEMPQSLEFLPRSRYAASHARNVAVIVMDEVAAFELGVLCEVFGTDRTADGFPGYDFHVCSPDGGPVRAQIRLHRSPAADLAPVEDADLVAVPAHADGADRARRRARRAAPRRRPRRLGDERLLGRVRARRRPACSTTASAPPTGATPTSCRPASRAPRSPATRSTSQDGNLLTSAGTAAGIDACLHLVRQEHGSEIATKLARRMVVPAAPRRRPGAVHRGADPAHARRAHARAAAQPGC